MPEYGYAPHIDSVRHREVRTEYEVFRFDTQLGGILLLQAPERRALLGEGKTPGYVSTPTAVAPAISPRGRLTQTVAANQTPPGDEYHDTIMYLLRAISMSTCPTLFRPFLAHFCSFFPVFSPFSPSCRQDSGNRHQDPEKRSETVEKRRVKTPKFT